MAVILDKSVSAGGSAGRTLMQKLVFPVDRDGIPKPPLVLSMLIMVVAIIGLGFYRWYMESTAFTVGLDYFEPAFETYWMTLLYAQGALFVLIGSVGLPWIWFTRPSREQVFAMSPRDELGKYILIFTVMGVSSILVPCVLGLWVEADAAWHQITIRDTDFTPTHIQLFYGVIPLAAVGLVLGLVWMHTRMPNYIGRVSIPLFIVAAAPLLIMPNLGYNEWGHTFFYAEELFAAPVHYGFVVLGWGLFAIGGFFLECINRILVLTKTVKQEKLV